MSKYKPETENKLAQTDQDMVEKIYTRLINVAAAKRSPEATRNHARRLYTDIIQPTLQAHEVKGWEETVIPLQVGEKETLTESMQGLLLFSRQMQARHTAELIGKAERQAGRKEVVDFVEAYYKASPEDRNPEWQAFLKSLNLED